MNVQEKIDKVLSVVLNLEQNQDKMISEIIDMKSDIKGLDKRVSCLETMQGALYNKIDGFLSLINRHEAEIAAVRSRFERLEAV